MATTRKILSKRTVKKEVLTPKPEVKGKATSNYEQPRSETEDEYKKSGLIRSKKACQFCSNKTEPHYFDMVALHRFLNDRGRIITRIRSGSCSKHQRRIAREIKRARHLGLLPFTVRV